MDISNLKAQSRTVEILHPATDEKIGLRVSLLPDSDPKVKRIQRAQVDRQLDKKKFKTSAAQLESNSLELLIAAIDGWDWYGEATFEGEKPEFTEDNVRRVLKGCDFIKDQIRDEFNNREAFYEG